MSNRFASVMMACALGSASSAALAQLAPAPAAPSSTVAPVIVQAGSDKAVRAATARFVASYAATPNPNIDQIARWRDAVCVQVEGLPLAAQADRIKARIESMAQKVGLPAAGPGCRPNVEIVFTDQPQSTIDDIAQHQEPLLGYYHHEKLNQLKTVAHPVQAWYVTATGATGVQIGSLNFKGSGGSDGVGASATAPGAHLSADVIDDPQTKPPTGCVDRFIACYMSHFYNVLIVADNKALVGKSLGLVADDMVMLALSQPRSLDGCNALPSVIDVFAKSSCAGRDAPTGLTAADGAYLSALYAAEPKAKKATALVEIASLMAKTLIKGEAADGAKGR